MHVYRCVTDEEDFIGIATLGSSILITVSEAESTDGLADAAELEITSDDARAVADKIRELLAEQGKAGEVSGVFLGRTTDDPGILLCVGVDGGTGRSVILSRTDAADAADKLTLTASEADDRRQDASPAATAETFADLTRRAAALKITATLFEAGDVDLFEAAEWVAAEPAAEAA
ncbi:hypothetical protein DMH01_22920 [Amycolatopsis sp. WAC 04182]|uniref:hypothetical protein n=1 Tax=Amycolatopsis sp. WAC 04182 TaxID=2203198 RepID=UPI000F788048|nr:hypothetical protein [Amycolatopsis sp. WAC 04182]RSN58862.1 hypothetical protein DMH01_22920 [Amycolatopsis sp. WAC 04182]